MKISIIDNNELIRQLGLEDVLTPVKERKMKNRRLKRFDKRFGTKLT